MAIDHQARKDLQKALVGYMAGRIRTFAFDDQNTPYKYSSDKSVQEIARFLYLLHDDFVDHAISVAPDCWATLLRIVAFLGTELEMRTTKETSWPFYDDREWHNNQNRLSVFDLPVYDGSVHFRPFRPWWDRIPSSFGFLLLGCIVAAVLATLFVL